MLIAARHFGYETRINYFPHIDNKNLVATITFQQTGKSDDSDLFAFINSRSTFRGTFLDNQIGARTLSVIEKYCEESGISLYLTSDEKVLNRVGDLTVRSDAVQFADPEFRKELACWIGKGVFGNSWLMSQIGSFAVTYFDLGKSTAKADQKVFQSAPVFGLLASKENDRLSQVKVGQVFERIYLAGQKFGLGVRPISQIVQVPKHKEEIKKLIPQTMGFPQQPFLLGYAEFSKKHTPRRRLEEVMAD